MSFLDLYQGDQAQAAGMQPNEGTSLPSGFDANLHAAWSDGRLFSQSIAQQNARADVLGDYVDEVRQKTGNDLSKDISENPLSGSTEPGVSDFDTANARVSKLKAQFPDLNLNPLSEDEISARVLAKAQAAHRNYEALQAGEKTWGGSFGSFIGNAGSSASDPVNIVGLALAPETGGIGILSAALRWGAVAGVSQAAIEATSDSFKEQVQPGYMESGAPLQEIGGAVVSGAVLGGGLKALGNAWTRVKTGAWPTSIRDAGNVIESEANVANTNVFPGAQGEVAHREALTKTIDDILAGRPVDVGAQITPELQAGFDAYHGSPHDFDRFDISKLGTGEGAQAYGHGLYFAENEKVARSYQRATSDKAFVNKVAELYDEGHSPDDAWAQIKDNWKDFTSAEQRLMTALEKDDWLGFDYPHQAVNAALRDIKAFEVSPETAAAARAVGTMYQVKITANKEHMLDFDKPMSEQSDHVRSVLGGLGVGDEETAEKAYRRLGVRVGPKEMNDTVGREATASRALSDAGIPGIKYLDQSSRRAGDGTSNFVVFNDKHIEVTHKNGKPVNAEIRQVVIDQAAGLPPKEPELPLAPETEPMAPKRVVEPGPAPALQTADEMRATLTAPDHQDAIRADIDRERAMGDFKVPHTDENGNHSMVSVDAAMDEVDAYKQAAEQIQACSNPTPEAEAA